ncbi:MAG TPA: DSD1 family PLP-dependent enzyme [Candidatus Angelobacter sp.]|nr:DSD1 family PLP-dependent enzyme [Candidatus Angelobacter sp.]
MRSVITSPAIRNRAEERVGCAGSRFQLPTPALVVDLDAFERNVARMAQRAATAGLALRPHAKSHKSATIGRRQIEAGATGLCCVKLGEAEALSETGLRGLLITSPVVGSDAAARASALVRVDPDLLLVVDHREQIEDLAVAASAAEVRLSVLIDIDVGLGRTGVTTAAAAVALAEQIASHPSLRLGGVQGYGGHWQHIVGAAERRDAVEGGMARLTAAIKALRIGGYPVPLVTGGGTGTFSADAALQVLNEVQPGSYIFMDNQYRDALGDDADGAFEQSLFVQAQVISINAQEWVTVDAGLKAFATDGPMPRPTGERFGGSRYFYFGDEHGGLMRPSGGSPIRLGERVEFIPPHCDPTVDRYDVMYFVRGDMIVEIAPIEAARRSQ